MKKSILIIGAGTGLSLGVAELFWKEGFSICLISRNVKNLEAIQETLAAKGIHVEYAVADVANATQLNEVIRKLSATVSGFDVVLYNAAVVKAKDILEENAATLIHDFSINVAGALQTLQSAYEGLKEKSGALLITGGGLAVAPSADYGSLSIGKAGIRSMAYLLHNRLQKEGIYVGLLTVAGFIYPNSETHSPALLAKLFWKLYTERNTVEIHQ